MNVLIIGGGGREHALTWKVAQSDRVKKIWVAPGNAGTAQEPKTTNVAISPVDIRALLQLAREQNIHLTLVGPEASLAAGIVDAFQQAGLAIFGPTEQAARLETSKAFCKNFLRHHGIPTARFATFRDAQAALAHIDAHPPPLVVKASGLAAGKGVVIAETQEAAKTAVLAMLEQKLLGEAGQEIVIEEFLLGKELSFIVMVDGEHVLPLASARDYKRRDNDNRGPNTGGMGAFSPVLDSTPLLEHRLLQQIIHPTVQALRQGHQPYVGFLYAGIMITPQGDPYVLEFNCRLGDPETEPLMMRLQSDLIELCQAALAGQLHRVQAKWDSRTAVTVVMANQGYPHDYPQGEIIQGLPSPAEYSDSKVFHAGTREQHDHIVTHGGRVLAATALGSTLQEAKEKAYQLARRITWPHCYYRTDIGTL